MPESGKLLGIRVKCQGLAICGPVRLEPSFRPEHVSIGIHFLIPQDRPLIWDNDCTLRDPISLIHIVFGRCMRKTYVGVSQYAVARKSDLPPGRTGRQRMNSLITARVTGITGHLSTLGRGPSARTQSSSYWTLSCNSGYRHRLSMILCMALEEVPAAPP